MFKLVTRMFKKKQPRDADEYQLPSDDPELNPILVEDDGADISLREVATLNSRLLAPVVTDESGMSVRTRAVVEMKNGLTDLASHIRVLGQRLHAQSMGQSKLIDVLTSLPETIKQSLPDQTEQTNALVALKLAMDEQSSANQHFVEALKPLPKFVEAAANLPETARKQMWAINELTKQLETSNNESREQSEQVRVMVETLATDNNLKTEQVKGVVDQLTKLQKAQLKQTALAVKSSELARRSQRRHHSEVARTQQSRLAAMQRDQSRHFNRIEEHFRRSARRQMAIAGTAVCLAVAAVTFAVLMVTGVIDFKGEGAAPIADKVEHTVDPNAVVQGKTD